MHFIIGPNRWASRVQAETEDGYELFGKKIAINGDGSHSAKVRNKFTLEVSGIDLNIEGEPYPSSPGSRRADQYEDDDHVNLDNEPDGVRALHEIIDRDDTAPALPKAAKSVSPSKGSSRSKDKHADDDEAQLSRASDQADILLKSAVRLEGWLEQQVPITRYINFYFMLM